MTRHRTWDYCPSCGAVYRRGRPEWTTCLRCELGPARAKSPRTAVAVVADTPEAPERVKHHQGSLEVEWLEGQQ